jgi:hypothetical protein
MLLRKNAPNALIQAPTTKIINGLVRELLGLSASKSLANHQKVGHNVKIEKA